VNHLVWPTSFLEARRVSANKSNSVAVAFDSKNVTYGLVTEAQRLQDDIAGFQLVGLALLPEVRG
jgi:hypothetical protein